MVANVPGVLPSVIMSGFMDTRGSGETTSGTRRGRSAGTQATRGRLKAHDPFELIRWLALSQPDPRKALAELVQNSLDAGARHVRVKRYRRNGLACLSVWDDGAGVIPEMERLEALRYIATHIGHSRKRSLSPEERLKLMTQGQYGIGLLGFWSLGGALEMRTSVAGARPFHLVLHRDEPDFLVEPLRGRLPFEGTWTEVLVLPLHREALPLLSGRRAADFLGSELRGQLLARNVDLVIEDRMSRGRSQKIVPVRPARFLGQRVEGIDSLEVAGHSPIRCEIYLAGTTDQGEGPSPLAVYSSGTLVAETFDDLGALGLNRPPWNDRRLTGMIDFAGFRVAPGSRRGFVPDEAAGAFAQALSAIEPTVILALESLDKRRAEELDRAMFRDLQRAFRDFYRQSPRYKMLPVGDKRDVGTGPAARPGTGGAPFGDVADAGTEGSGSKEVADAGGVLLAGPLASVRLTPSPLRVECRGTRTARAIPLDAGGVPLIEPVRFDWSLEGSVGRLRAHGDSDMEESARVILVAGDTPAKGVLRVAAYSGDASAAAHVMVEIVDEIGSSRSDEGIPEPELINEPAASWRSRIQDGRWQVNIGHAEYRAVSDRPALKLRLLAMLFAKEIVLRSSQDPRLDEPLEQLVEIASYADRNLSARKGRGRRDEPPEPTG